MGAEERQPQPDLGESLRDLEKRAGRFAFFRLVYLLERLHPKAPPVGQLGPAPDEKIRLRSDPSLVFHSSDITECAVTKYPDERERVRVSTTFMSLYGSTSPLPPHFAERIALSDYQGGPQPSRELFDLVHHRLLSLLYRTWTKYRFSVMYRTKGTDPFTRRMFCSIGLDGFREVMTPIDRFLLLRYAPILASKSRAARSLEVVLTDVFGNLGIRIEQFIGHWTLIEKPLRNKLGVMNCVLGQDLTIGRYVYDGSGRFNIVLGPLGYDDYLSFLPGGHNRPVLKGLVDMFTRGIYDVNMEIHVQTEAAPRFQLGSPRSSTIGRTAWLGGSQGQKFVVNVPLEDKPQPTSTEPDDEDRGEPPDLPPKY